MICFILDFEVLWFAYILIFGLVALAWPCGPTWDAWLRRKRRSWSASWHGLPLHQLDPCFTWIRANQDVFRWAFFFSILVKGLCFLWVGGFPRRLVIQVYGMQMGPIPPAPQGLETSFQAAAWQVSNGSIRTNRSKGPWFSSENQRNNASREVTEENMICIKEGLYHWKYQFTEVVIH